MLDDGLCFFLSPPFFLLLSPTISLYHSCYGVCFVSIWLNPFGPAVYSSPNGPTRPLVLVLHYWWAPVSHLLYFGHPEPVCFPQASSALFLTSHHHGFLLNSLGFLGPITLFLILGVYGLAINPLLFLFSLLWACSDPFSLFHIIYCPWFAFSLFPGSVKPIYLFKTHLLVSWACDPLFLPVGLNRFSIRLPTPFCLCCWASLFYLGFRNGHQQLLIIMII